MERKLLLCGFCLSFVNELNMCIRALSELMQINVVNGHKINVYDKPHMTNATLTFNDGLDKKIIEQKKYDPNKKCISC